MKIIFYRYNSICEPDYIDSFKIAGLEVIEETAEMTKKEISNAERVKLIETQICEHHPIFVFSINFYPVISEICKIYNTLYLCQTVDSPVPELFHTAVTNPTNRIFLFDREQYNRFSPYNQTNIYHLPLAAGTARFDRVLSAITSKDRINFSHDISFVGSLYSEKNPFRALGSLPDDIRVRADEIVNNALTNRYALNLEKYISPDITAEIKTADPDFYILSSSVDNPDSYIAAHQYLGCQVTQLERIGTLNALAEHFNVDLYTLSDPAPLKNIRLHKGANSLTEMPKIFNLSKINLNMTTEPIMSGLPLRIFDIMGCGGFLMSNLQPEITDYFEIGVDLETYSNLDELIEKCQFYLTHDEARIRIAANGREKVAKYHTHINRIVNMIKTISN